MRRPADMALLAGCLLLTALFAAGPAVAQEISVIPGSTLTGIGTALPAGPARSAGSLDLAVETAVVFKNLELFGLPDILGRTWFLYLAEPRLRYRAAGNMIVEAGLLTGRNLGDDDPLDIRRPVLRLVHRALPGVHVVAGTLLSTHPLHDALLDDVRKYATEVEEGFQLRANRNHYASDTWINWRIREGAVRAEEFEIGSSQSFSPLPGWITGRGQFLWTHAGGQVSLSDRVDQNLMYLAGVTVGPGMAAPRPGGGRLVWCIGHDRMWSRDESANRPLVTGSGHQTWARLDLPMRRDLVARLGGARYRGKNLVPALGDPLYGLDRYDQVGLNLVLAPGSGGVALEAGFVKQWTADRTNLTYQLTMTWNGVFSLGRPRPAGFPGTAP